MKKLSLLALGVLGVFGAAHAGAALTVSATASGAYALPPVPQGVTVLYDQTDNAGTNASSSQDFETSFDAYDNQGADDFVVPAGESWTVTGVDAVGAYWNGAGPAASFNVYFYADASGLPGSEVGSALAQAYADTSGLGSPSITFDTPVTLSEGTYWVSIQARMDFSVGGQWGWQDRTVQSGAAAAWQNPGGGFGGCGTTWEAKTNCVSTPDPDFIFRINGTAGASVEPLLTVDLTVENQLTITAGSGVSEADASGDTGTGWLFENLFANAGTQAIGTNSIVGTATLTAASVPADGSPALFRANSGTDAGLNIWSYSSTSTTTFTAGQVAFDGTATWTITPALYAALLTAPSSGNLYFPADDSSDIATATLLGTYEVIFPGAPVIDVTPSSLTASQAPDTTTTQTLTIGNTGTADLTWTIDEAAPAHAGGVAERLSPRATAPRAPYVRDLLVAPMAEVIQEGGFEDANAGGFWDESSATYGTVLCDAASCGTGGGTGPHSGSWWVWFGGSSTGDVGYAYQDVVIPTGATTLTFWLEMPAGSWSSASPGYLAVSVDSTELVRYTEADVATYGTYTQVSVDISAFADGNTHTIKFDSTTDADGNFFVDDVSLDDGSTGPVGGCDSPSDLPWVSLDSTSGTTAAGGTTDVTVTFDSTGMADGTYEGVLCVNSNDTATPRVEVPVTLTVATGGGGGELLVVDLSVANQVTITATSGVSAATVSGSTTTGWLFENFFSNAGTQAIGTNSIVGTATLTAASVPADGSPSLYRNSNTDAGLNIWSYSATSTTTFTAGQVAFTGTATWSITPELYAAMLTAPSSGNLYFPADDTSDLATATLLGTYTVIGGGSGPTDPVAQVTPTSLDFTVEVDDSDSAPLTIANIGGGTLTWSIAEAETTGTPSSHMRSMASRNAGTLSLGDVSRNSGTTSIVRGKEVTLREWGLFGTGADISQMADNTPQTLNGVGCGSTGNTADNSWWRRFYFGEHAEVGASTTINSVTIGSETGGPLDVTVNVYTTPTSVTTDTIDLSQLTLIGTGTGTVGGDLTMTEVAITGATIADTSAVDLVVEYHVDGGAGDRLFPAGNPTTETHPTFISSAACSITDPTPAADIGFPDFHLIMVVNVGDGAPPTGGCSNPSDVPWLSVSPASGSAAGGSSSSATVTVDATGMAAGDYDALLCVTTNDPANALVQVPVSLTVEQGVMEPCTAADTIFCDGFDGDGGTTNPDIVTGEINLPITNDFDGSALDLVTGTYLPYDAGRVDDINLYNGGDGMYVYWYGDAVTGQGGVSTDGVNFDILQSGATVGPSSPIISSSIAISNWWAGADGYFGIAFLNEDTGEMNYGYIHVTTSSPDGFPGMTLEYAYDRTGAAITIP